MAVSTMFTVAGMTCGHCASSVTAEISKLAGVRDVHVDLDSGRVDVTADRQPDTDAVRTAVREAGYEVTTA